MFNNIPKPLITALSICLVCFGGGITAIGIGFAFKSLSSENIDLQIANENIKVSAKLNETKAKQEKVKLAADISSHLVGGIKRSVEEERKLLKQELLTEIVSVQGSYCSNQLMPLKEKIEAIEARSALPLETEEALLTVEKTLEDTSESLEELEKETEEEIQKIEQEVEGNEQN